MSELEKCAYCNILPLMNSKASTTWVWWSFSCRTPGCVGHQTKWYASAPYAANVWNSWQRHKRQIANNMKITMQKGCRINAER